MEFERRILSEPFNGRYISIINRRSLVFLHLSSLKTFQWKVCWFLGTNCLSCPHCWSSLLNYYSPLFSVAALCWICSWEKTGITSNIKHCFCQKKKNNLFNWIIFHSCHTIKLWHVSNYCSICLSRLRDDLMSKSMDTCSKMHSTFPPPKNRSEQNNYFIRLFDCHPLVWFA